MVKSFFYIHRIAKIASVILLALFMLLVSDRHRSLAGATITGGQTVYAVEKGDCIDLISAKFGVSSRSIILKNGIDVKKLLRIGQKLVIDNRRIVPKAMRDGILINIPERMLYLFRDNTLVMSCPVGLGIPSPDGKFNWKTPTGRFTVTGKVKDPTWHVPASIQREMEKNGEEILITVPPGDDNPLGRHAIKTSMPGILIHATIWPTSIHRFRSHGCVRVRSEDMEGLFREVRLNTPGEVIYAPVKLAIIGNEKIFIEVHGDPYKIKKDLYREAKDIIEKAGLSGMVDWTKVSRAVSERTGLPEDVAALPVVASDIWQ